MNFPRPFCEEPVLIFNRNAIYNLVSIGEYYLNGERKFITPQMRLIYSQTFPFKKFSRLCHMFESVVKIKDKDHKIINWEGLENSYCGFDRFGKRQYLFLAVPCNHCTLCTERKQDDFYTRCLFENQTSSSRPMMVTLTYDPMHLPFRKFVNAHTIVHHFSDNYQLFDEDDERPGYNPYLTHDIVCHNDLSYEKIPLYARNVPYKKLGKKYVVTDESYKGFEPYVCKRDVQKFLKRLRINWSRSGRSNGLPPLRYVCFAEYGHKTGRPHYHFIMWNVPYPIYSEKDFGLIELFKRDILKAWNMCEWQACQCEVARDAAKYVGKYISKNMTTDDGKDTFRLASNRHGGIGAAFLDQHKDFLREYPSVQRLEYIDKWSGQSLHSTLGLYALNRVFPTASKQIPDTYKQKYRYANYLLSTLAHMSICFGQNKVAERCELLSRRYNFYPSVLPDGCNSFASFDNILASTARAPMFYEFIIFYDSYAYMIDKVFDEIDRMKLPSQSEVLSIESKRNFHNNLFSRPDVTDELIVSRVQAIRAKREERLAREIF